MGNSSFTDLEISKFKEVSYKLGKNPSLVQAAGGNTSIKSDKSMLIKASGTWLINSLNKDIFVEVNLPSINQKISNEHDDSFEEDIISKNNLRPSLETSFHALINSSLIILSYFFINSSAFFWITPYLKAISDSSCFFCFSR